MTLDVTTPHEATNGCVHVHCYAHGVDEPLGGRVYAICFECKHLYQSRWELSRCYLGSCRAQARVWRRRRVRFGLHVLRRAMRPSRIMFCPLCLHDF